MKILLVDDDTFLRDMYATKFVECGHEVTTAVHAADGLRLIEQDDTYELVIVDMIMPGMTGVEMMEELGIPYHVVVNCGGDLGQGQVKKYDIEAWLPPQAKYRETH